MSDAFSNRSRRPSDPPITVFPILPDDATDLAQVTLAVNVTTPGSLRVTMADGSEGTLSIAPGHAMALRVRRVWQTGTTATGITGLA